MDDFPRPPFPEQQQPIPGATDKMDPRPDHGESTYKGSGRLQNKKVLITGGDSGIGRAVAIAFAREGADLLVSYLNEHQDAEETRRLVEPAGHASWHPATSDRRPIVGHWSSALYTNSAGLMCWSTMQRTR
jgi:hypothetical protein